MAFTDVFGGNLIFPSQLSYLSITTAVDITLQWPTEQQITGDNVVADFLDINATVGGLTIDMPDARNTSEGNKTTVNNIGGNAFTVRDNTGGVIQFVGQGEQWVIVLTDNATQAGLWSAFQLGAATTLASASALAGAGLQANIGGMLEQIIDSDVEAASPITVVDGDRAKCLIYIGGAGVANLPSAGVVFSNWFFMLRNSGSGTLSVVPPSGSIDGSSSLNLDPNSSAFIFTDGTDYFTIGLTASSTIAFDFVSIPIPGSGDFVLSGANLNRIAYRFTGALTGNRKVVVPDTTQQYWCDNQTTGAFVLSIATAAQATPPTLDAGTTAIFYSNSTEVIDAVNAVSVSFPILISQGGTSANNAPDALVNLRALPTIEDLTSVAPAGGDFIAFQDIDDADNNKRATIDDILAGAAGVEQLIDSGGNIRVRAETLGIAQLRSVADTDAEDRLLNFTHQDGTLRGQLGYVGDANLVLRNSIPTGDFILETQKFGGGALDLLKFDSSGGDVTFLSANVMRAGFDNGDTIWRGQVNSFLTLHFDNIEVARTALTASGGLFVTNLATGAGSERVLTTSDLTAGASGGFTIGAEKSASQSKSNDTVLADDSELFFTLPPGTYIIHLIAFLFQNPGGAGAGFKYQLSFDGTFSRMRFTQQNRAGSADAQRGSYQINLSENYPTIHLTTDPGGADYLDIEGIIVVTGSGTLSFEWAQQVSNANNTTVNNSSSLTAQKLP